MLHDSEDLRHRFNAVLRGVGDRTVVLGHGIGTDHTAWAAQVPILLEAGYRVLTFDFAGATPQTQQFFSTRHHRTLYGFAEDLLVLLHSLQLQDVSYVGHSMGGMIGLLACVAEPTRFRSLTLLGASARYVDDASTAYVGGFTQEQVETLLKAATDDYTLWANGFAPHVVGAANPYLRAEDFTRSLLSLRPDVVHTTLSAALLSDHRAEVERLQMPLNVLQASTDFAVPMSAARWLAQYGHARTLIEIPTQGHLPHITAPEAVNAALVQCLIHDNA